MNNEKIYRHSFTKTGTYIGCREVPRRETVKVYLYTLCIAIGLISYVYLLLSNKSVKFDKNRSPIVLEVPMR